MRQNAPFAARAVASAMAFALGLSLVGPVAQADDSASSRPAGLAQAANQKALKADKAALRASLAQDAATDTGSVGSFFGSTRGKVAIVLFAGMLGYTIYSKHADRLHSQVR